jgi:hypothetical protein
MARKFRKLAVLLKSEAVYGTDSVPTGAANAMQVSNAELTPLEGEDVSRDLVRPELGHQGIILVQNRASLAFDVEIAGSGVAGTAPGWGPAARACGRSEVIDPGVDVEYVPDDEGTDAVSIYFLLDGVRHILLGSRGNMSWSLAPGAIPRFRFTMKGLLGTITDQALPAVDLVKFIKPVPVSKANTTMTLHGWAAVAESLSIDLANQVEGRFLIGHESIEITDRKSTGTAVVEARSMATKNWFQIAQDGTLGALAVQHGIVAGNIIEFSAAAGVQIGRPTQGQSQGIANYSLPLMFTGVPDLTIRVR